MAVSVPFPTLSDPPVKEEIEANFAALVQKFGAIDADDLAASADVGSAQMANPYQDMVVKLGVRAESLASGWPGANTVLDAVVIPGEDSGGTSDTPWRVVQVSWACNDTGSGLGTFELRWAEFHTGAFNSILTLTGGGTIVNTGGANGSWAATTRSVDYDSGEELAFDANPRSLVLLATTADAAALSAAASFFEMTVVLRRTLRAD